MLCAQDKNTDIKCSPQITEIIPDMLASVRQPYLPAAFPNLYFSRKKDNSGKVPDCTEEASLVYKVPR